MSSNDRFQELATIYALGGLTNAERYEFEAHLKECAECRQLVQEDRTIVAILPLGVEAVQPSPETKQKLLSRIDADLARANVTSVTPTRPAPKRAARRSWFAQPAFVFGVVVILALLALGAIALLRNSSSPEQQQIAAILGNPNVQKVALKGTDQAPNASGELYMVPGDSEAVLKVSGLQPLSPERAYEFWFIRGQELQPSNVFAVNADGTTTLLVKANDNVEKYNAWGVSIEPKQGVLKPTGPIVILGGG